MPLVYGVCLKYLKQAEDAQDAVMNIYEELTVKLHRHEIANFKSWLYTLARNHCLMKLRADKGYTAELTDKIVYFEETLHQEDVVNKELQLNKMEKCIEQLNEEQRKSVSLFYLQDKCYKEIAEITGNDINKVRSYIQNGRRNLKICMENLG